MFQNNLKTIKQTQTSSPLISICYYYSPAIVFFNFSINLLLFSLLQFALCSPSTSFCCCSCAPCPGVAHLGMLFAYMVYKGCSKIIAS